MELTDNIRQYIDDRCSTKLEEHQKKLTKAEKEKTADEFAEYRLEWQRQKQELLDKFKPDIWLTDASKRAKQISLVTHALKYTHSDAKGTSLMMLAGDKPQRYVSSSSLSSLRADVVGNAAALDVANLLLLESDGVRLLDLVGQDDPRALTAFGNSEQQQGWIQGFKEALKVLEPASHTLAKQLYFPVEGSGADYHLLAPLAASSLNHALFQRVQHSRFSDDAKAARDARRKEKYWHQGTRDYPSLATQTFGGTKPQNISLLNSQRGGRAYLLSAQPPVWKSQAKPPKSTTAFWAGYRWWVRAQVRELKDFLEQADQHNLNNLSIREKRAAMVAALVDAFYQYSARIRLMEPGWSAESFGINPEACWLDPSRTDEDFVYEREGKGWCKPLALTFGRVLVKALNQTGKNKKLEMADNERMHFKQQIQREAYRLMMDLEELV